MDATLTAPSAPRNGRKRALKIGAIALGWLLIATTAWALFLRTAAGTVTISTSSPEQALITLDPAYPVDFNQTGQDQPLVLRVDPASVADGVAGETYAKYTLNSAAVNTGPCAGFVTVTAPANALIGGTGVLWRNPNTGAISQLDFDGGTVRRTEAPGDVSGDGAFVLTLSNAAPAACADQASIPLEIELKLIP